MKLRMFAILTGVMLLLAACTGQLPGTTEAPGATQAPPATDAPSDTEAPGDTEAPATTQAPGTSQPVEGDTDADGGATPWWLLVVVGGAFLILIIAFVARGSKKEVIVAQPKVTWKDTARLAYADARWLYDALSEDLAVWRGNAKFDDTSDIGATAATALAQTWQQLETRIGEANNNLYALEASAPDQRTAEQANTTITTMRSLRKAVDNRAESRMGYRTVEASETSTRDRLVDAREREVRTSRALAEARGAFGTALTNLSTLL